MPLPTDRALLDAFRRGDKQALTAVYYEHVEQVAALARRGFVIESQGQRFVPGAHEPEEQHEIVQEVFARAFAERARLAYDGLRPYRPYLLRIAKNLLIDRLRARSTTPLELAALDADGEDPPADAALDEDREELLDWQRLTERAKVYLAQLDDEARTFVRLRFEEERSQDEVAREMGITRRRVRTLEERVELELAKQLEDHGMSAR
jgi:RNA polymerase sigma-70 factor (ECF subfamily)